MTVPFSIIVDRDNGTFDFFIDYFIPAYNDPETGEQFSETSWNATYSIVGGPAVGGQSGYGSESGFAYVGLGLDMSADIRNYRLDFTAMNLFSAESVSDSWNILTAAYATDDLTFLGTSGTDVVIGGAGADVIRGFDGNDVVDAGGGDDIADGGNGADLIDGGAGDDIMTGGAGADIYLVDSIDDVVVEKPGGEFDIVQATVSYVLGNHVEGLTLVGYGPIDGTGNAADNRIIGTGDVNVLSGLDGADLLQGQGGADRLVGGNGNDMLDGGTGDDVMEGGSGNDTYYVDSRADRLIETTTGGTDTILTAFTSFTLGANIERLTYYGVAAFTGAGNDLANLLTGGIANDRLDGRTGDDRLEGGAGDDRLTGGAGADLLVGGAGTDTALYGAATAAILLDLATGGTGGEAAGDRFSSIENVEGSSFADTITGNNTANRLSGGAGADRLTGAAGNDVLIGGAGADILAGGDGIDTVSYVGSAGSVTVDLGTSLANGGDAQGDLIGGFENATGGAGADTLIGSAAANILSGGGGIDTVTGLGGNDTIIGGAGADVLSGGEGIDTLSYEDSSDGVAVSLATGLTSRGDAAGDQISGFENLTGGAGADLLTGNEAANILSGGAGVDRIDGGAGNDTIAGGAGADQLKGGDGVDTLSFATSLQGVYVDLSFATFFGGDASGDVATGFENLLGSNVNDALIGDAGVNRLNGRAGFDYLDGGTGNDILTGGSEGDIFVIAPATGHDIVTDFMTGDLLQLSLGESFDSFTEVMAVASQSGSDVILNFDHFTMVTLQNVAIGSLAPDSFLFA